MCGGGGGGAAKHRLELGTFKVQNLMPNTPPVYQVRVCVCVCGGGGGGGGGQRNTV